MKSTVDIQTTLTRCSDTGGVSTTFSYVDGMPSLLVITQKSQNASQSVSQRIELTIPESRVLRYIMHEMENISGMVSSMDEKTEEERPRPSFGLLRGR